jgi:hypothetical protein
MVVFFDPCSLPPSLWNCFCQVSFIFSLFGGVKLVVMGEGI